jgi:hypothetical protein
MVAAKWPFWDWRTVFVSGESSRSVSGRPSCIALLGAGLGPAWLDGFPGRGLRGRAAVGRRGEMRIDDDLDHDCRPAGHPIVGPANLCRANEGSAARCLSPALANCC